MAYNCDNSEYIEGELFIDVATAGALKQKYKANLPSSHLLHEVNSDGKILHPHWCGEWSGRSFDEFKEILSHTTGTAKILMTWEGGDSMSGLIVENGTVSEGEVVIDIRKEQS